MKTLSQIEAMSYTELKKYAAELRKKFGRNVVPVQTRKADILESVHPVQVFLKRFEAGNFGEADIKEVVAREAKNAGMPSSRFLAELSAREGNTPTPGAAAAAPKAPSAATPKAGAATAKETMTLQEAIESGLISMDDQGNISVPDSGVGPDESDSVSSKQASGSTVQEEAAVKSPPKADDGKPKKKTKTPYPEPSKEALAQLGEKPKNPRMYDPANKKGPKPKGSYIKKIHPIGGNEVMVLNSPSNLSLWNEWEAWTKKAIQLDPEYKIKVQTRYLGGEATATPPSRAEGEALEQMAEAAAPKAPTSAAAAKNAEILEAIRGTAPGKGLGSGMASQADAFAAALGVASGSSGTTSATSKVAAEAVKKTGKFARVAKVGLPVVAILGLAELGRRVLQSGGGAEDIDPEAAVARGLADAPQRNAWAQTSAMQRQEDLYGVLQGQNDVYDELFNIIGRNSRDLAQMQSGNDYRSQLYQALIDRSM